MEGSAGQGETLGLKITNYKKCFCQRILGHL